MYLDEGHEPLPESQCWDLLRQTNQGRVGITIAALPAIVPVHYAIAGPVIAFPTDPRTKLTTAADGHVLAFQADADDADGGWSVHAVGRGELVTHHDEQFAALARALAATGRNPSSWIIRLAPVTITGSRIPTPPSAR